MLKTDASRFLQNRPYSKTALQAVFLQIILMIKRFAK